MDLHLLAPPLIFALGLHFANEESKIRIVLTNNEIFV